MDFNSWLSNQTLQGENGPLSFNPDEGGRYSLQQRSALRNYGFDNEDGDVGSFLQSAYQRASDPKYGNTPLNFGDNGGFFGDAYSNRSVQIGGSPYQRVLEDWTNFDKHPDQGIRDWTQKNRSALGWNDDYGYLLPQDKWNELSTLSARYNRSQEDWIDKGYGGLALLAIPAAAVAAGYGGAVGAGAAGAEGAYGAGLASELGTAGAYGGSMAADAAALSGGAGATTGAGSLSDLAWGVNPQTTGTGAFDMYGSLGTGLPYGSAGYVPADALAYQAATGGNALAGLIGGSGGGMTDFFSSLFTPKNLLSAGTQLGSALLQNSAINKAVDAQTGASDRATAATMAMYNQNRADLEPWRTAGGGAVSRLASLLTPGNQVTQMELDPGYQFRLGEGQKAIERSAAARGKLFSGQTGKALTKYGQDFATSEFTNVANRLLALAGLGQTSATNTANLGQSAVRETNANTIGAGNARASGYVGGANAITGSLSNFLRNLQEQEIVDALRASRT